MTRCARAIIVALGCVCLALGGGVGWMIRVAGVRDETNARHLRAPRSGGPIASTDLTSTRSRTAAGS